MDKVVVYALFGIILLLILCTCCYLAGYKKGTQDIAKFHNSVWRTAEREAKKEALNDGKGD